MYSTLVWSHYKINKNVLARLGVSFLCLIFSRENEGEIVILTSRCRKSKCSRAACQDLLHHFYFVFVFIEERGLHVLCVYHSSTALYFKLLCPHCAIFFIYTCFFSPKITNQSRDLRLINSMPCRVTSFAATPTSRPLSCARWCSPVHHHPCFHSRLCRSLDLR